MTLHGPGSGDAYVLNGVCEPCGEHEGAFVQREKPEGLIRGKADVRVAGFIVKQLADRDGGTAITNSPEHIERVYEQIRVISIAQILDQEWHDFWAKAV